jgi:hypothetical protein
MQESPVLFQLVLAILGTWRIAHLVSREDGPFDAIVWLRTRAGAGSLGRLMDCPHCVGLWIAMPFAWWIAPTPGTWVAAWLGISGGASLAQRLIEREAPV